MTMTHDGYMRLAIEAARSVPRRPFGTVIVRPAGGECVAVGANRCNENPILHGEIDAINRCAAAHPGIDWSELALYTTAEPCAMCLSAIAWAGIPIAYYGTSIPDLRDMGWNQIDLRAEEVARRTPFRAIRVVGGILESECNALFEAAMSA
jgi:tRNA(Arg) A34 adenosine deaminase TadA